AVQYTSRFQVAHESVSVKPKQKRAPSTQVNGAQGTRKGRCASGRVWRNTSTPRHTTPNASRIPMEMRSASRSRGKMAAISAANTPVIAVDTCGVLKRGGQRLMNEG